MAHNRTIMRPQQPPKQVIKVKFRPKINFQINRLVKNINDLADWDITVFYEISYKMTD